MPPIFYQYIDCISPFYDPLHTIFHLLSIHTNRIWAHYLGFCLHFSFSCLFYLSIVRLLNIDFDIVFFVRINPHFMTLLVKCLSSFLLHFFRFIITYNDPTSLLFKSNLNSTSICLARPCLMWYPFTSSHHDFNSFTFLFYFFWL